MPSRLSRNGSLHLSSDPEDVEQLLDKLEKILETSGLDEMSAFHLRCAVIEVVNNCIQHAYQNKHGQPIEVTYIIEADSVRIGVFDRGPDYLGPSAVSESAPIEESGRGFEIINAWVSSLQFERINDWNVCWLEQKSCVTRS